MSSNNRPKFHSPKLTAQENRIVSNMLYRSWRNGRASGIRAGMAMKKKRTGSFGSRGSSRKNI